MTLADPLLKPNVGEALTPDEFATLLRLARKAIRADDATRRKLQQEKINLVPHNFYSSIPGVAEIESSFEFAFRDGPYNSSKVFKSAVIEATLDELDAYADEFDPPVEGSRDAPQSFFWKNPAFSFSDAMAYYCMLRRVKPAHVLEIGSGFSTLAALQALEKNGRGRLTCVEPFPMPWLAALKGRIELLETPAQSLEPEFFNQRLTDGDVLFIDSTHTVKAGSDCLHIYLRVLPELTSNLTVHAHDIYLPFPMPRADFARHIYWTEQYLLYAYLLENSRTEVIYGSMYCRRFLNAKLKEFMRGRWPQGGASLWFRLAGR
ncbi:MAG TPA: class I SAM-dependent methyltransferase [Roseiarcus sp.]|nr:class I SAM-dependent methyltransferase [Roseiarcus sp.]